MPLRSTAWPALHRRDREFVHVEISSWEIECCVPPPAVGELVSWPLLITEAWVDPYGFDHPTPLSGWWHVERSDEGETVLTDGLVTALWSDRFGAPPSPGAYHLVVILSAVLHSENGCNVSPAITTGRVRRVQVISQLYEERADDRGRFWGPVPHTVELRDVARGPGIFAVEPRDKPCENGGSRRRETGLLVELEVPPT